MLIHHNFLEVNMGTSLAELLHEGSTLSKSGDDSAAIASYLSAVKVDSENATAWYCLGVIYAKTGLTKEAIEAFERSDTITPNHPPTMANLAYLLAEKDPIAASEYARSAMIHISGDEKLATIAEFSQPINEPQRIFIESRKVVVDHTPSSEIEPLLKESNIDRFDEARSLTTTGDHSRAVALWKGFLEDSPNSSEVWRGLGEALRSAGYDDRANQCLKRAEAIDIEPPEEEISLEPDDDDITASLMIAAEDAQTTDNTEQVRGDLDDAIGWYNMGINLLNEGNNDEALSSFEKAIGGCPPNEFDLRVKAQNGRGNALYNAGRFPESVVAYHTAIGMNPNSVTGRTLFNMGSSYAAVEMFDDAIKCFTQALERGLEKQETDICEKQISRCRLLSREQSRRQSRTLL